MQEEQARGGQRVVQRLLNLIWRSSRLWSSSCRDLGGNTCSCSASVFHGAEKIKLYGQSADEGGEFFDGRTRKATDDSWLMAAQVILRDPDACKVDNVALTSRSVGFACVMMSVGRYQR